MSLLYLGAFILRGKVTITLKLVQWKHWYLLYYDRHHLVDCYYVLVIPVYYAGLFNSNYFNPRDSLAEIVRWHSDSIDFKVATLLIVFFRW